VSENDLAKSPTYHFTFRDQASLLCANASELYSKDTNLGWASNRPYLQSHPFSCFPLPTDHLSVHEIMYVARMKLVSEENYEW
jgi:hypothetical protein